MWGAERSRGVGGRVGQHGSPWALNCSLFSRERGVRGGVLALPEEASLYSDGFLLLHLFLYQLFTEAPSASVDRNLKQIND